MAVQLEQYLVHLLNCSEVSELFDFWYRFCVWLSKSSLLKMWKEL